jgi:hypothetical protein
MNWLIEESIWIWAAGAVALTLAGVIYWETRSAKSFYSVIAVLVVTAALLFMESIIESPREAVARALDELAEAVEANDVQGALAFLSPKAVQIRSDVETLMPQVEIEMAHIIDTPSIEVDESVSPMTAVAKVRGVVRGKVKNTSMQGTVPDELTIDFEHDGQRWLIRDYTSQRNWARAIKR